MEEAEEDVVGEVDKDEEVEKGEGEGATSADDFEDAEDEDPGAADVEVLLVVPEVEVWFITDTIDIPVADNDDDVVG